jgi:hypothetical protein
MMVKKSRSVKRKHPRGNSGKRLLTHDQEFEIMKLVLDKFLWVGLGVMVYGIWKLVTGGLNGLLQGVGFVVVGAIVLMLFMALLVKEFEFIE